MDKKLMLRAVELARKGLGFTSPNPPVGALLVSNNKIISEGFHLKSGLSHAEVNALKNIDCKKYDDLSLYVTLEPCSHHGKTAPCLDLILKSNIKNVYIGIKDPNPKVNGKSIKILKNKGINVELLSTYSSLAKDIRNLMKFFLKSCINDLPYVTLKAGISLDSKIATTNRESKWITNEISRNNSRKIRSQYDSIIVGSGTVIADNPKLKTVKPYLNKNLLKVIIDKDLTVPLESFLMQDNNLFIAHTDLAHHKDILSLDKNNIKHKSFGTDRVDIEMLLKYLKKIGIQSVFVEGGSEIHGSFYDSFKNNNHIIDDILFYMSPIIIGGKNSIPVVGGIGSKNLSDIPKLNNLETENIDGDLKITGYYNSY